MAQYQHLPLYKASYDLVIELMNATKSYPRDFKYSLAEKIQNKVVEIVIDIYRANNSKDKKEDIKKLLEDIQYLGVYIRISSDLKIIALEKQALYIEKLNNIEKQATGWQKALGY